jgi:putative ATPase
MSLLSSATESYRPLADEIRPTSISEVFGQDHLFDPNSQIGQMIRSDHIQNIILWGPSGSGKTTLARILAKKSKCHIESLSAVVSGTQEIKHIFVDAQKRKTDGVNTILIVDEIHHFNRTQQDIFLPYLEDGTITLIGATTENPSFELNSALLSRCIVVVLKRLDRNSLEKIVERAECISQKKLPLAKEDRERLYEIVDGDGRYLLNICEGLLSFDNENQEGDLKNVDLHSMLQPRAAVYDKSRDGHYNLISALHKALRGSDGDASLYWLQRMMDGGENLHYILRRLVRVASEDIGLADPNALVQVMAAKDAYDFLGSPEGELAIIQATLYLAAAPKSNSTYLAHKSVIDDARKHGSLPPPFHILNAPTKLMKAQGYSDGYIYDHSTSEGFSGQNYFPEKMLRRQYYKPSQRGFEKEINKRLDYWGRLRKEKFGLGVKREGGA